MTNYQKVLDRKLEELKKSGEKPSLLLHCCCAPCSSYVLEYLSEYFQITAFYFNPNITDAAEYQKRVSELKRLLSEMPLALPVRFQEGGYQPERFFNIAKGLESVPEGGERCFRCYRLRLAETADEAKAGGYSFFTTTLSISPLKNAEKLNEIGAREAERVGVPYLFSDFKKKEGYKRSIQLRRSTDCTGRITAAVHSAEKRTPEKAERAARSFQRRPNMTKSFFSGGKCPFQIFVDQAGYFPDAKKRAVLTVPNQDFFVETVKGERRFEGKTIPFGFDALSGDDLFIADFTEFSEKGRFRLCSGDARSAEFEIGGNVYESVFDDVLKAYYYLRCGCGLEERYAGVYRHGVCHDRPALLWEDKSRSFDVTGGWHDAGDYGRYTTAGACAAAHLLYAYKLFPEAFHRQKQNIPESGMPCVLSECRWELEWLMKMQRPDGAVYHKVTTLRHAPFVMPEEDDETLYLFPVSSMAAADLAAVCALGAGIYQRFDPAFSERLKNAAERSYEWLEKNPGFLGFRNPPECNTGEYGERDDFSNRFWASAELYALTGEPRFHESLKKALERPFPLTSTGYTELGGLGALAYLFCGQKKEAALEQRFRAAFADEAKYWLKKAADSSGYGVAMRETDFHWGSNMTVMQHAMTFAVCDALSGGSNYKEYAAAQLHYLLGVNANGCSFVTGTGEFCCNNPHLRPAYADEIEACIPGMVCGGPNRTPNSEYEKKQIPKGTPPMKCYVDDVHCYSLNEITIYWNSPAVFVLAYLTQSACSCEKK